MTEKDVETWMFLACAFMLFSLTMLATKPGDPEELTLYATMLGFMLLAILRRVW